MRILNASDTILSGDSASLRTTMHGLEQGITFNWNYPWLNNQTGINFNTYWTRLQVQTEKKIESGCDLRWIQITRYNFTRYIILEQNMKHIDIVSPRGFRKRLMRFSKPVENTSAGFYRHLWTNRSIFVRCEMQLGKKVCKWDVKID